MKQTENRTISCSEEMIQSRMQAVLKKRVSLGWK